MLLTRRQFGRAALGFGATVAAGAGLVAFRNRERDKRRYEAATQPAVTGANSLNAHAALRGFLYGAAVDPALLDIDGIAKGHTTDAYTSLVAAQTGILVAENAMKWAPLQPKPGRFHFAQADRLVRFANLLGKQVRGHNLCWHEALPIWFPAVAKKENARQILTDHIHTVVGHFRGQIHSWDVVNEAIEPADGDPDGLRKSPWLDLIGPDYIELAFRTAAEADPQARLTYNDYGIETNSRTDEEKRWTVLVLLRRLKARGVPIHAVGVQSHLSAAAAQPGTGLQSFIREVAGMGLQVFITELDVNCHGLDAGPSERDAAVAKIYRNYLELLLREPNVPMALTWGITSTYSWMNESFLASYASLPHGAHQRPLPFDDEFNPTPAFSALRSAFDTSRA